MLEAKLSKPANAYNLSNSTCYVLLIVKLRMNFRCLVLLAALYSRILLPLRILWRCEPTRNVTTAVVYYFKSIRGINFLFFVLCSAIQIQPNHKKTNLINQQPRLLLVC